MMEVQLALVRIITSITQYHTNHLLLQAFLCTRSLYDPCLPDDTAALHDTLKAGDEPCTLLVTVTPWTAESDSST